MTYAYDAANRLTTVTDWNSRQTLYTYDANNRVTGITRPGGTHQTYTYNAKGQVTTAEDRDSQNALISRYEYTYDAVGNIVTETSTLGSGKTETNVFSAVDRLTSQTVTENGIPVEQYGYTYDAGGNLLTATNNGITTTFTNGNANRIATVNGQSVTYDADGNITAAPLNGTSATFSFDSRNRLAAVGTTSYTYNAENQRIGKAENGIVTSYVVNPIGALSQTLMKTTGGTTTYYVYGLGLIAEETGTDYKTYHFDLRGSTIALTGSTGLVTDTYSYGPYGELLSHTGTSQADYLYNGRDGVITDANGLYHMRARYYSPELRRFLNEDEYAGKYDDILNVNLYAYCEGNPIGFVDPSGYERTQEERDQAKAWANIYYQSAGGANGQSYVISFIPIVGDIKDIQEVLTGKDLLTGQTYTFSERGVTFVCALIPVVNGKAVNEGIDGLKDAVNNYNKSVTKETLQWLSQGEADNIVYYGIKNRQAVYTGITKQDIAKRLYQHNYGPNGKGLSHLEEQISGLTKNQARAIEQYLIEHGPANAMNKANSISPKSQYYNEAMQWAEGYLKSINFPVN